MTADRSLQASFPKQRKSQSEYYPSYGYMVILHLTVYSPVWHQSISKEAIFLIFSSWIHGLGLFFLAHIRIVWTQDLPMCSLISAHWLKETEFMWFIPDQKGTVTTHRQSFSTSILMRNLSVPLSINCTSEQGGQNCFNELILTPASFQAHGLKYTHFLSLGQSISYES